MTLQELNKSARSEAEKLLFACCGSEKWLTTLMESFPFKDEVALVAKAESAWYDVCNESDWLEAFSHHPKIGDIKSLSEKFAGKEQESVATASAGTIEALAAANAVYDKKFGFIFIVCATGKPAGEMLRLLNDRIRNSREEELHIAMGEQHKITIIRLKKLLDDGNWQQLKVSQLTSHVLDTSVGTPAHGITIRLQERKKESWHTIAQGVTNKDGRVGDLLPQSRNLKPGNYKIIFETGDYFTTNQIKGFYPVVEIDFTIFDESHYHVPLLVNPFGYSTYRGS